MSKAVYEKLKDGTYSGKIPQCPGVIAFGETLYQCQEELRFVLEGWIIVKIRHGDKLPVIGGINLNKRMPALKEVGTKWARHTLRLSDALPLSIDTFALSI